ncbi:MAG: bifunctional precorrin-2 dehydrogenase/sirohydrochlorin ferrochelatase [Hespellia sp.]|nr:bifunctional precorrin-2 dehydrogenase/sirohydrochlorin ferrochelatase [Hespellia sp.]
MSEQKIPFFPLFVDLSKKLIVVIGGGVIATRRVKALLPFGTEIVVIAPEVTEELKAEGRDKITIWKTAFGMERWEQMIEQFGQPYMIIAATNRPVLNAEIAAQCKIKKILVNVIDQKELCDFYFPGIVKKEEVVIGITASGQNHKRAREVRQWVQKLIDNE